MTNQTFSSQAEAIDIMLVSHTNAGKTTLLRTLLGKDVGEVLDAPDVTKAVSAYDLVVDDNIGALRLWDTPGFGDSFRLDKRLRQKHRWIAWMSRELWDRYQNPRLWRSQRVALDLRDRASVILYLVNSLERPVDAVYIAPELEALTLIGKPVLVILNQCSDVTPSEQSSQRISEWHKTLAGFPIVRNILRLDSYTRCWLQELVLLDEIGRVLPERSKSRYCALAQILHAGHQARFDASVNAIAEYLLSVARDKIELNQNWFESLQDLWSKIRKKIPWGKKEELQPHELAMESLTQRFINETKTVTDRLIVINRLSGVSAGDIVETVGKGFSIDAPADTSTSALAGGVISGAIAGLGADLMSGGLTLGTGVLVGAVLGAASAAALAKGYNVYSCKGMKVIGWSADSLMEAATKSVMLYLAIAHFGRGQGEWRRKDDPEHWIDLVGNSISSHKERMLQLWGKATVDDEIEPTRHECAAVLKSVLVESLLSLYPETPDYLSSPKTACL